MSTVRFALVFCACFSAFEASAQAPQFNADWVMNAASYAEPGVLAPGTIFALFGNALTTGASAGGPSTALAGTRLLANGEPSLLYYASPNQINAVLPQLASGATSVQLQVETGGGAFTSAPVTIAVVPALPGIFTLDYNGAGPGIIVRDNGSSLVCPSGRIDCAPNPALPGEAISFYVTGVEQNNGVPSLPLVAIGGLQAPVLSIHAVAGATGLFAVDVVVPLKAPAGNSVQLNMLSNIKLSNSVSITIAAPSPGPGSSTAGGPAGLISAIVIDPVNHYTVYAGTPSGVYKSTNAGISWAPMNNGLIASVNALAIDPSKPSVLYAGTEDSGVFKSANGGASWTAVNAGLGNLRVTSLAIDPSNPSIVYAGLGDNQALVGPYKSTDGGAHWASMSSGLLGGVELLAISPSSPNILYAEASSNGGGLYRTVNSGLSWTLLRNSYFQSIAVDPHNPFTLYTATFGSIGKTIDGGTTWSAVRLANEGRAIALDPANPANVFVGGTSVWMSANGGLGWVEFRIGLTANVLNLAIDPSDSRIMYAGTAAGVFRSVNAGLTWSASSAGLTSGNVTSLAIDPAGSALYAGTDAAVFKTSDGGASWQKASSGLEASNNFGLSLDSARPTTLYVCSFGHFYRSVDGGASWSALGPNSQGCNQRVVVDPANSAILYSGNLRSTDAGATWTRSIATGDFANLAIDPLNTATLYATTFSSGVYKSVDRGVSWVATNSGIPLKFPNNNCCFLEVNRLVVDPLNPLNVYILVAGHPYKSPNGGASWAPSSNGLGDLVVTAFAVDPGNSAVLLAAVNAGDHSDIYRTTDHGANWVLFSHGLTLALINWLVFVPSNSTTVYAATRSSGVLKSTDGGAAWQPTGPSN